MTEETNKSADEAATPEGETRRKLIVEDSLPDVESSDSGDRSSPGLVDRDGLAVLEQEQAEEAPAMRKLIVLEQSSESSDPDGDRSPGLIDRKSGQASEQEQAEETPTVRKPIVPD